MIPEGYSWVTRDRPGVQLAFVLMYIVAQLHLLTSIDGHYIHL